MRGGLQHERRHPIADILHTSKIRGSESNLTGPIGVIRCLKPLNIGLVIHAINPARTQTLDRRFRGQNAVLYGGDGNAAISKFRPSRIH